MAKFIPGSMARSAVKSLVIALLLGFTLAMAAAAVRPLTIQGDRWLTVDRFKGQVEFIPYEGDRRQIRIGDRLSNVGDIVTTGANASARLAIDFQTGFVNIAENSQVQVQTLSITNRGGRITHLRITKGQVRLSIRRLTNPDTEIELHTPAGVSGVRGTDFGIAVQPDGQTGVATIEGSVNTRAQGQTVTVSANLQTVIYPGEPPLPPEPLRDDPTLFVERLETVPGSTPDNTMVRLVGYTDKVNLLKVNGDLKRLSRQGRFNLVIPFLDAAPRATEYRISATVTTPLGTEQQYELVVP